MSDKIIIKKKTGPGELTGITEIDITQENALFRGLQFTESGDYVLSITTSNNSTEPKEISVKVLDEDKIISQESKGTESKKESINGTRPIIAQIDKPTIKLPPIKMDQDKTTGSENQKNITTGLGYTPFIWYKSYQIADKDIRSLRLYHDGIIPKIKFTFIDSMNMMKSAGAPTDDTTIELFLNSTSANLKSIHMSFKIENFSQGAYIPGQKFEITGTINIPNLYLVNNKSYNDTSFGAIRQICKDLEIGFNSNIDNTQDKMPWRNSNKKPFLFIDDIIFHSYISDESFMIGYIDYYYCFNYVDVEKEFNRDISNDVGIDTSGTSQNSVPDEADRITKLKLTNDRSANNSCFFFDTFTTRNDSTKKSLTKGYSTKTKSYDRLTKSFLVFDVDSTTSDGNKNIILKGRENDPNYFKDNYTTKFTGKIDTDNVHKNYNYSVTQNRINLDNLNKIALNIKISNPNFNLYKFQKVNVEIINDTPTPADPDHVNWRYSGDYIIADISFNWNGTRLTQDVRLVRKELGKTPEEINQNKVEGKKEEKQINENPVQNSDVKGFTASVVSTTGSDITGPTSSQVDDGVYVYNDLGSEDEFLDEEYSESTFQGEEELAVSSAVNQEQQSQLPPSTSSSTLSVSESNINYNSSNFVGGDWKKFDINTAIASINKTEYKPLDSFVESLKKVLYFIKNDGDIKDIREGAYLLGTAFAESGYSLQRWEADYACIGAGIPYGSSGPCSKATNYYKSTKGKKNYYTLGTDNNNQCYFGRGLIQLTGKSNYKIYGDKIGVDLVGNGDLAMVPLNSYKVASVYMRGLTFKWVLVGNLTKARKSVNGGSKGIDEVNGAYQSWLDILKNSSTIT